MKLNDARAAVKHTVFIYKRIHGNSTRYETAWPSYNFVNEFNEWKICLSCVSYQIRPQNNRKTEETVDENPEIEKSVISSWRNDSYSSLTTRQFNVMYVYTPRYAYNRCLNLSKEIWSENLS